MSKKKDKIKNKTVIARNEVKKQSPKDGGLLRSARNDVDFRWAYIFLFVFATGLYINTLHHGFAFDDSVVITGNKYTKQGFEGIKTLASKDLFYGIYGRSLDLEGGR